MRKLIDFEHPFFAPAWIRITVVAVLAEWGVFEIYADAPMWGIIFLGIAIIAAWRFSVIDYSETPKE